jgi:molecular chaperone IbpA
MIHMVYTRTPHAGRDLDFFSSLGIGSLVQEFDKAFATTNTTNYPPYNIIKFNDNEYSLQFAVAGFKKPDIEILVDNGVLKVSGKAPEPEFEDGAGYVHKGIAARKFSRSFSLPEYFEVDWAGLEDGILSIGLTKKIPDEKKPKTITIN